AVVGLPATVGKRDGFRGADADEERASAALAPRFEHDGPAVDGELALALDHAEPERPALCRLAAPLAAWATSPREEKNHGRRERDSDEDTSHASPLAPIMPPLHDVAIDFAPPIPDAHDPAIRLSLVIPTLDE